MNRYLIKFTYLLVLNFELVLFMVGGIYGGLYLNKHYPVGINWLVLTTPLSLLLCLYLLYRYLVGIIKIEEKKADKKIEKNLD
ncbi:MAG: hypothetical protein WCL28_05065 [bacterium]|jgi:hypothetical protein